MSVVKVCTGKAYEVHIERGSLSRLGTQLKAIKPEGKVALITDSQVETYYLKPSVDSLRDAGYDVVTYVFPQGEAQKNSDELLKIVNFLADESLTRSDMVVALGGGVVGDMAGFAAATYLRGIDYVQVPTSLLAMVDSSVGGKTAVNLPSGKNLWGAFKQPILVLCDPDTLQTLPEDEFINGCGEVIKYGMLGYPELLDQLEASPLVDHPEDVESVIEQCVKIKAQVVANDETEKGQRQFLNFGHTFGHGIEKGSHFTVHHGYSVAIGMAMMMRAAGKAGVLNQEEVSRFLHILEAHHLPTTTDVPLSTILDIAKHDKKSHGHTINLVLPAGWGYTELRTTTHDKLAAYAVL